MENTRGGGGEEDLGLVSGPGMANLLTLDRTSLSLHFETLVKKIGQMVNENTKEELMIECLEGEIEDLERETNDLQQRRDNFSLVENDLALIQAIVTEEERAILEKKRAERENAKILSIQREQELEEKKAMLKEVEVDIKEFHVKIEENELKRIGLQKKIQLKAEKIEKILGDIEVENKVLRDLNEAALQRSEDLAIIKEHEDLIIQRDSKLKELEKLKQKKDSMEEKIGLINQSLEKIEKDLIEAREAKDLKVQEIEKVQEDFDSLAIKTEDLQKAVEELETLDSEITFLNYYISKAELKLMQYKKENRAKLQSEMENAKLKQVQTELMSLPTTSYSDQGRGKIDSTVKNILDRIQMSSPQSQK